MSVTPEGAPVRPVYARDSAGLYYRIGGYGVADHGIYIQPGTPVLAVQPTGYPLWLDTDEPEVAVALGNRNRLLNGDISVNQRAYTTGTTAGVWTYVADRWACLISPGSCSLENRAATVGELPESATRYLRITTAGQNATSGYAEVTQAIEGARLLSGKTVTYSFWARAAAGAPFVAISCDQTFGGGGSTAVSTHVTKVQINTTWTRYSVSWTIPSIAGKTVGTNDYFHLRFWTSAGSDHAVNTGSLGIQSNTIDFWGMQLEEGAVATPYEQKTYSDELFACLRYYYRTLSLSFPAFGGSCPASSNVYIQMQLPRRMRTTPTLVASGAWNVSERSANFAMSGMSLMAGSTTADVLDISVVTAGATVGRPYALVPASPASYLEVIAEFF